jgi:hypothetical protein
MSKADAEHDWTVTLDGSPIHFRRLDPDDYDAVVLLSLSLTDDDRYLGFFTTHPLYLAEWGPVSRCHERSSPLRARGIRRRHTGGNRQLRRHHSVRLCGGIGRRRA